MRAKIISDGTTKGTKVVDVQSGQELENVTRFLVTADAAAGTIVATIFLTDVELEIFTDDIRTKV